LRLARAACPQLSFLGRGCHFRAASRRFAEPAESRRHPLLTAIKPLQQPRRRAGVKASATLGTEERQSGEWRTGGTGLSGNANFHIGKSRYAYHAIRENHPA